MAAALQIELEKGKVPAGIYTINLSLDTPHVVLTNDGQSTCTCAIFQPYRRGGHQGDVPDVSADNNGQRGKRLLEKAAAASCMLEAYQHASGNGKFSANARQVMYSAGGRILELTGLTTLGLGVFSPDASARLRG